MRVQDPVKYAEVLLAIARPREGYTENRIRSMFGSSEIEVRLPVFIPVHVTYQTAFVNKDGKLQIRDDIYGQNIFSRLFGVTAAQPETRHRSTAARHRVALQKSQTVDIAFGSNATGSSDQHLQSCPLCHQKRRSAAKLRSVAMGQQLTLAA